MSDITFKERYKSLNKEQKLAVDTIEGPVLVVAGPGTGKTEILTLRIGNILQKTDVAPENILALTFTDAGATNMRRRLSRLIGPSAYRVVIETFHSFCNNIIKNYPEYFPNIIGSSNITEAESFAILENLLEKLPIDILRPWGDKLLYIFDIHKKIGELKREGLTPENYLNIVKQEEKKFRSRDDLIHEKGAHKGKMKGEHLKFGEKLEKNKELALIYAEYQKVLAENRQYDWNDMIMEVLKALEKEKDLKLILQETHQYILVDEHQDTNNAQNKIIELLCDFHKNPNIFVVGDEKQAIFRFQGASAQNFFYFKKLYPEFKVIELGINYRSTQSILDSAHSLLPSNVALVSNGAKKLGGVGIYIGEFEKKSYELYFVTRKIKELIEKEKVPAEEIAVLYRKNKEAFALSEALERAGVPYVIESDEDLFSEKYVRKLLAVLSAIFQYGNDEALVSVLHIEEFSVDPLDSYRLVAQASREKASLYDLLSRSKNELLKELGRKMKSWARQSKEDNLSEFIEKVLRESGILHSMISSKDARAFLGIEKLFEEGKKIAGNKRGATFDDFMRYLNIIREHKLLNRSKHTIRAKAVRLMTAHKSKGLEFEYVFIINATENSFGEKANRDKLKLLSSVYEKSDMSKMLFDIGSLDDERRLFYVCITRAKKSVFITYPSYDENDKEVLPSTFVLEIRPDRKETIDTAKFEKELKNNPDKLFVEKKSTGMLQIDREFVSELFLSRPLSVSALNNYLSCPWKYFYRNLLRIPTVQEKYQIYGTAMHSAVEDLWKAGKERDISEKFLLNAYRRHLGLLGVLSDREFKEALDKGVKSLTGWFKWAKPKITNPIIPEFSIRAVELSKDILLSGNLDKVEMVGEKTAFVTDYKTGKQHSRNDIEGKTKSSTGDMMRQLQFYKLLLSLHSGIEMQKGIIEFLEPNEAGNFSRVEFEVPDSDVLELKKTVERVAEEITTLSFWNEICGDKDCKYCGYRSLLKN